MTGALAGTVAAYVVIAVLLLSLNIASQWKWWIKAGAIVVTGAFFGGSYMAISGLMGWPSDSVPPRHFQLLGARVVEPDKLTKDPGAVFLWIEALDENNVPSGTPRAFRIPYSEELARALAKAEERRQEGQNVGGRIEEVDEAEIDERRIQLGTSLRDGEGGTRMDSVPFIDGQLAIHFEDLPDVALPDKGPL